MRRRPSSSCSIRSPASPVGPPSCWWRRSARTDHAPDNTPGDRTASLSETVTVTDPTHPLYGLTLPLLRVGVQERVGRIGVVHLRPDVERRIPLVATSLSGIARPISPARLSVAAVAALLATVATIPELAASIYREVDGVHGAQEGRDGAPRVAGTTTPRLVASSRCPSRHRGRGTTRRHSRWRRCGPGRSGPVWG